MEGRSVVPGAAYWIAVGVLSVSGWQIRQAIARGIAKSAATAKLISGSTLPRKTSKVKRSGSVPQTDTGGRVEKTKANE